MQFLKDILLDLFAQRDQARLNQTPAGFGRKHRAQLAAGAKHPGFTHFSRQVQRQRNRAEAKAQAVAERRAAIADAPAGSGCAGFHRTNRVG